MSQENKKIAIQETYGPRFQYCWGCGPKNEDGLHMKSYPSESGDECICTVRPDKMYTGGVPKIFWWNDCYDFRLSWNRFSRLV